jgi:hypothetical protein
MRVLFPTQRHCGCTGSIATSQMVRLFIHLRMGFIRDSFYIVRFPRQAFMKVVQEPPTLTKAPQPSPAAASGNSSSNLARSFTYVTDITPTILDLANVTHPDTYKGKPVHPMMGKSLKPLLGQYSPNIRIDLLINFQNFFSNECAL